MFVCAGTSFFSEVFKVCITIKTRTVTTIACNNIKCFNMPPLSLRKKRTQLLKQAVKKRLKFCFLCELFEQNDEEQDCLDKAVVATLALAESTRYHQERIKYRKPQIFLFEGDLNEDVGEDGKAPWLKDWEFQQNYWCS